MDNKKLKKIALKDWIDEAENKIGDYEMDLGYILVKPKWIKKLFDKFDEIDKEKGGWHSSQS